MLRAMHHEVAVLRTDLAGIGAMASGAASTSIGLSAALRHTVAAGGRAFAQQDRTPRVLVDRLLSWPRGSQLAQVVRDDGILTCECPVCHGRPLRRFAREDAESVGEAATHSVLTWRAIADRMLAAPPNGRRAAWLQACADALDEHAALRARSRIGLQVPDYLNWPVHWKLGEPIGQVEVKDRSEARLLTSTHLRRIRLDHRSDSSSSETDSGNDFTLEAEPTRRSCLVHSITSSAASATQAPLAKSARIEHSSSFEHRFVILTRSSSPRDSWPDQMLRFTYE